MCTEKALGSNGFGCRSDMKKIKIIIMDVLIKFELIMFT